MAESIDPRPRLPVVDVARGVALLAMVVYHLSWDLAYARFVPWDVSGDPLWRGFAAAIAGSFLLLSGLSLVLAAERSPGLEGPLRRIGKLALAAAAVSLATYLVFPDSFVFFGILHMIAVGSLLGLPLRRAPVPLLLALAAFVLILPQVARSPAFDHPAFWPLGLSATIPPANDYVPVFPWFAPILVGMSLGRLVVSGAIRLPAVNAGRWPARAFAVAGRWSLVIYLLHQPLLFGAVDGLSRLLPPDPGTERIRFVRECTAECAGFAPPDAGYCPRFCGCVADALEGTAFWSVRGGDPEMSSLVAAAAGTCRGADSAMPLQ